MEKGVLKTIAGFNNYEGGVLIVGIGDKKEILGLDLDFNKAGLKDNDRFELHLRKIINDKLTEQEWYLANQIKIYFKKYKSKTVCIVKVAKGDKPIYTKDNKFYLRTGNRTVSLNISEIPEYVNNNFNI
jgi:predicted HTH transcriptional regulator